MYTSHRLLAVLLAVAGAVRASPTRAVALAARADATTTSTYNTDAWISVGSDGKASTVTPALTTISGVPTVVDASPTTSGTATTTAQPKATATSGVGSFPVCSNVDGELAPFCAPSNGSTLNPGSTYYITWDTKFFSSYPNSTVILTGNLYNDTTGEITTQAFSSNTLASGWSFYAWTVDKALLKGASSKGVNISISMSYLSGGNSSSSSSTHVRGPIVRVAKKEPYRQPPAELPSGAALYIGLPAVFLFIAVMVLGTFYWNRHHRQIDVASIRPRSRFSKKGYGVGRSRRQRTGAVNLDSKDAIALQSRQVRSGGSSSYEEDEYDDFGMSRPTHYTDTPTEAEARHQNEYHLNNNSEALGSLAGTGNAFRDELRRQNDKLL